MFRNTLRSLLMWLVIAAAASALWRAGGSDAHNTARLVVSGLGTVVETVARFLGEMWHALFGGKP